jgi:hypothetical protein
VDKYFANATTLQDIPLIISDRSLVSEAPSPTIAGSVDAELGYPRGQLNGCNSCTAPPDANLDSNAGTCTNPPVSVCAAAPWNNDTSYCGRWSPEFFGEVNVVNGQVTPVLKVSPIGWYRLRLVNGANTRTYALSFEPDVAGAAALLGDTNPRCYKIATEAGYTLKPLTVASPLKMLPAERVELLCDFRGYTSAVSQQQLLDWQEGCCRAKPLPARLGGRCSLSCTCVVSSPSRRSNDSSTCHACVLGAGLIPALLPGRIFVGTNMPQQAPAGPSRPLILASRGICVSARPACFQGPPFAVTSTQQQRPVPPASPGYLL